jgi:hypothetical protein
MIDSKAEITEKPKAELEQDIDSFKENIAKADGTLIPLSKTTADGKPLYVAAKKIDKPCPEGTEGANPNFFGWRAIEWESRPMTSVLLIDIYLGENGEIKPLGHIDWWMNNDYANGGGNMHSARIPATDYEKLANTKWPGPTAFKIDYDYHKQNLGSFLVSCSAVVLPRIGVNSFYTGILLENGQKTYARFGIEEDSFKEKDGTFSEAPIDILSGNSRVNESLAEFV